MSSLFRDTGHLCEDITKRPKSNRFETAPPGSATRPLPGPGRRCGATPFRPARPLMLPASKVGPKPARIVDAEQAGDRDCGLELGAGPRLAASIAARSTLRIPALWHEARGYDRFTGVHERLDPPMVLTAREPCRCVKGPPSQVSLDSAKDVRACRRLSCLVVDEPLHGREVFYRTPRRASGLRDAVMRGEGRFERYRSSAPEVSPTACRSRLRWISRMWRMS